MKLVRAGVTVGLGLAMACSRKDAGPVGAATGPSPASSFSAAATAAASAPATVIPPAASAAPNAEGARLGQAAPDFTLSDTDGKGYTLSALRGKVVVLEWFNPDCPFVRASHTKGSLVGLAAKHQAKGAVWLAINSSAPGKQGHGAPRNARARTEYSLSYPVLLDETGRVGKLYGAERTPHLYVIDAQGTLVYRGAIDNSPDGEREEPEGGKLINYVDDALAALTAGKPVRVPETKAYGCSVKY